MYPLKKIYLILNLILLITVKTTDAQSVENDMFDWDSLPSIPDPTGFAGSFAGIANDVLIVAGGSNFPNGGAPWTGAEKQWYDRIYILEKPGRKWKEAGHLPFPLGYGVSVSIPDGLLVIGGSNAEAHYNDVFLLRHLAGKIQIDRFPGLPFRLANSCGALMGRKVFIAGGLSSPLADTTLKVFLTLDLDNIDKGWQELSSWPGPSRMLAVAGVAGNSFYLFSGTELEKGNRKYLDDAYAWSETEGWKKISNLPFPVVAAPSPAFTSETAQVYIFGGDTGADAARASELREKHPGFSKKILRYDTKKNKWITEGDIYTTRENDFETNPNNSIWAPVTTPLVKWNSRIIIPGGEVRPATRTPRVLVAEPILEKSDTRFGH